MFVSTFPLSWAISCHDCDGLWGGDGGAAAAPWWQDVTKWTSPAQRRAGERLPSLRSEKIKVPSVFTRRVIASHEGPQSQVEPTLPET